MDIEAQILANRKAQIEAVRTVLLAGWPDVEKCICSIPQEVRDRRCLAGPIAEFESVKEQWTQSCSSATSAKTLSELEASVNKIDELTKRMLQLASTIVPKEGQ